MEETYLLTPRSRVIVHVFVKVQVPKTFVWDGVRCWVYDEDSRRIDNIIRMVSPILTPVST